MAVKRWTQAEIDALLRSRQPDVEKPKPRKNKPKKSAPKKLDNIQALAKVVYPEYGLPVPEFEYRFHPVRKWRFDIALPALKIAIEVEGGVFTQGRHTRGAGAIGDMEKYNTATVMGWRILRFTPDAALKDPAMQQVKKLVEFVDC